MVQVVTLAQGSVSGLPATVTVGGSPAWGAPSLAQALGCLGVRSERPPPGGQQTAPGLGARVDKKHPSGRRSRRRPAAQAQ